MNKFWAILSTFGFILAYIFYFLFDREKHNRLIASRQSELAQAKATAEERAVKRHEEVKDDNVAMARDIADQLDK